MLVRILESPIVDVLLIILAIRFIWPGLFGIKKKKSTPGAGERQRTFVNNSPSGKTSKAPDDRGEYIDYEEIK